MLLTTALAIAAKVAAKAVIGNAIKELICTGETNSQALEWAVDKLGNDNSHVDIDDFTIIGSDLWDFITDAI